jgi:hypothetical protein
MFFPRAGGRLARGDRGACAVSLIGYLCVLRADGNRDGALFAFRFVFCNSVISPT